jgi:hypothetical protein
MKQKQLYHLGAVPAGVENTFEPTSDTGAFTLRWWIADGRSVDLHTRPDTPRDGARKRAYFFAYKRYARHHFPAHLRQRRCYLCRADAWDPDAVTARR